MYNNTTGRTSSNSGSSDDGLQSNNNFQYFQYYRRQTPQEDLESTQHGIDILVRQRNQLVNQLVEHYNKLKRSNEIDSLFKFSKQIDSIMRLRGVSIVPSPNLGIRPSLSVAAPVKRGLTRDDMKNSDMKL